MQPSPRQDQLIALDDLVSAIRDEARRRGDTESAPGTTPLSRFGSAGRQRRLVSEIRILDGAHIREFLPLYGEEFLIVAYRTILKRSLDSSGSQHYLQALLTGRVSRWELLGRLRFSSEGRAKKTHLRGLWLACIASLVYRLPVIGFVAALLARILVLPQWLLSQTTQEMQFAHLERRLG